MYVWLSICLSEVWYLRISSKYVENIQFNKNVTRITGDLYKQLRTFMTLCHSIPLKIRYVSEKIKIHILYLIILPPPKIVSFMRKREKCRRRRQATDDNILRRMFFACRKTKGTDTEAENLYIISCNNGYANAPLFYKIRTPCVLLSENLSVH